jgi:hypothetical protein
MTLDELSFYAGGVKMSEETVLTMQQGEGRWVRFTVTSDGAAVDLSGAEKLFGVKENQTDTSYIYEVTNAESSKWDVTQAASGIIRVNIPATTSSAMEIRSYDAALRLTLTADTDVDITPKFTLKIIQSVIG